jgi:hypothetical protein
MNITGGVLEGSFLRQDLVRVTTLVVKYKPTLGFSCPTLEGSFLR